MTDATIRCPKCGSEIPLTEAMAGPLLEAERQRHSQEMSNAVRAVNLRAEELARKEAQLGTEAQKLADVEIARSRRESERAAAAQIEEARQQMSDMSQKLAAAQRDQAEAVRKSRELDDARRELDLTVAKRVNEESSKLRDQIITDVSEENRLKVAEKELTISQLGAKIRDLQQKVDQGSQQLQGEVQELELERELMAAFPVDRVEPIGKGIHGADCRQHVTTLSGVAGSILWESKRTKNWGGDWLAKLRDDQRSGKDDVAVLVSRVLPDGVRTFGLVENVWVTAPAYAVPLAVALRATLTGLAAVRAANVGQQEKAVLVYRYLTGPGFRGRVEAVVERFTEMREDLDRERKFTMKQLSKREEQLGQVVAAMSGLYGDLQGIAGKAVAELPGFAVEELK